MARVLLRKKAQLQTLMKTLLPSFTLAICALIFATGSASAAPKSHVKERGEIQLSAELLPAEGAATGATASAEIVIKKTKFNQPGTTSFTLTTSGLVAGEYSLDGLVGPEATLVHLADFVVDPVDPANPVADEPITVTLPADLDAALLTSLSISDSTPAVILEGDVIATSSNWTFLANVQVTGPDGSIHGKKPGKKSGGVSGHVISQSTLKDGAETKRHFLWVAFGAPADTELTILADGLEVGTVTSTSSGKVMFHELSDEVELSTVSLITLTDGGGAVVMQAQF